MVTRRGRVLCIFADMPRRRLTEACMLEPASEPESPSVRVSTPGYHPPVALSPRPDLRCPQHPHQNCPALLDSSATDKCARHMDMALRPAKLVALQHPSDWRGISQCGLHQWSTRRASRKPAMLCPAKDKDAARHDAKGRQSTSSFSSLTLRPCVVRHPSRLL